MFGLEWGKPGNRTRRFYVLEADCSTEPILAKDITRSSFLRKVIQYQHILRKKTYATHFGFHSDLYVLTVTTSKRRITSMKAAAEDKRFWFYAIPKFSNLREEHPKADPSLFADLFTAS